MTSACGLRGSDAHSYLLSGHEPLSLTGRITHLSQSVVCLPRNSKRKRPEKLWYWGLSCH